MRCAVTPQMQGHGILPQLLRLGFFVFSGAMPDASHRRYGAMPNPDETNEVQDQREADQQLDQQPDRKSGEQGDDEKAIQRMGRQRDAERERANSLQSQLDEIKAKQREADEAKAREEGKFKELLEAREKELAEMQVKLAALDSERDLQKAVREAGLPDDLAEYVKGGSYDEMLNSAKALAKRVARPEAPDTDSGKRGNRGGSAQQSESLLANYTFGKR